MFVADRSTALETNPESVNEKSLLKRGRYCKGREGSPPVDEHCGVIGVRDVSTLKSRECLTSHRYLG